MVSVPIREETFVSLQTAAEREHIATEDILEEAVQEHLHKLKKQAMAREQQEFLRQHAELYERYANQHIAMMGGKVIDHDADFVALFERIHARYPNEVVMLTQVEKEPDRELRNYSARFARDEQ